MKFDFAYPISHFEEGEWYQSLYEQLPSIKIVKRCDKTIIATQDGNRYFRMRIRKGWNDCEYAFPYTSSKDKAYWATLKENR